MGPVLARCGGCGVRVRLAQPEDARGRVCPHCGYPLVATLGWDPGFPGSVVSPGSSDAAESPPARPWRRTVLSALALLSIAAVGFLLTTSWDPARPVAWESSRAVAPRSVVADDPGLDRAIARSEDSPEASLIPPRVVGPSEPALIPSLVGAQGTSAAPATRSSPADEPPPSEPTQPAPPSATIEAATSTDVADAGEPRRIRVQTGTGRAVVARVHGTFGDQIRVMMPDGQLGVPRAMIYTDEPFRPATADEMRQELLAGPFPDFHVRQSAHYLVLYRSTPTFAEASVKVLEELYRGLTEAFRKRDIPVHEPEFPLVTVIFRTEKEFRAHREIDRDVQAYYEIYTNRIYFYQGLERDERSPEVAALRKPQTVAHEGTHQILQNVGVQPRLSSWPIWLVEGMAEYCSAPVTTRKGVGWRGLGVVNPLHMATIRDLEDPLSLQVMSHNRPRIGRDPKMPLVEYLVTRTDLTPTDYALAWALTHYLALKRGNDFVAYLKTMSQIAPLKKVTPEEHLANFRAAFSPDLSKMDRALADYLAKLKGYDQLPYYAVMFEQRVGGGMIKRAAIVSQSPSMIRQWLESVNTLDGAPPSWEALPHPTRARALLTAEQWMRSH